MLVALLIEDTLEAAGCVVVGPFARVAEALAAISTVDIDAGLLDVNLAGEKSLGVAELLEERGVPFLFLTGYGEAALPRDRPQWEAVVKPFYSDQLIERLARKIAAASNCL